MGELMKTKNSFVFLFAFILIIFSSCNKKAIESESDNVLEHKKLPEQKSINEIFENIPEKTSEIVLEYVWDETPYNDKATVEFCINDLDGRTFCLYHNIRKVPDWNSNDFEIYSENWRKQNINNLSIIWNYRNGAILIMETEDPAYSTKRGIRVGDSSLKVLNAYKENSKVFEWDADEDKFIVTSEADECLFWLYINDDYISINSGNLVDEEMMTTRFYIKNGCVEKISISCIE